MKISGYVKNKENFADGYIVSNNHINAFIPTGEEWVRFEACVITENMATYFSEGSIRLAAGTYSSSPEEALRKRKIFQEKFPMLFLDGMNYVPQVEVTFID